jgi:hypothetical protein
MKDFEANLHSRVPIPPLTEARRRQLTRASFFFLLEHVYYSATMSFSRFTGHLEGMPLAEASARFIFRQERTR